MSTPSYKKNPLMKIMNSTLINLPAPTSLSYTWNMGSLLFMCLTLQILTGILLASTYSPSMSESFYLVNMMMENSNSGWFIRYLHTNGASLFFVCLYTHIGRGLYYKSYRMTGTWLVGVTILVLTMASAFLGYVLPVTQMSFWGASVITNLFSEVPYIGNELVQVIWGGPSVDSPTILRFFTFHFMIPFIILILVVVHITYLHTSGSSNPLGILAVKKIIFQPYYSIKDFKGVLFITLVFAFLCLQYPLFMGDNDNFVEANPSVTPQHIQPEWYFLFAYAILRSVPNKLGGVVALIMSIIVLYTLPFTINNLKKSVKKMKLFKTMFWVFCVNVILLSWIGMCPVEEPYILTGQILTLTYFLYFIVTSVINMVPSN